MAVRGVQYAWEDIQVATSQSSVPLEGILGVDYGTEQDKNYGYGRGSSPHSIQRGNKRFPWVLTIKQSEFEAWQRSMPPGTDLTDLRNITVTVSYAPAGGTQTTDQGLGCEITGFKKAMKQGDGEMAIDLQIMALKNLYNI